MPQMLSRLGNLTNTGLRGLGKAPSTVDTLIILDTTDPDLTDYGRAFGTYSPLLKLDEQQIAAGKVSSWEDFYKKLHSYRRIEKLVLFLHGTGDNEGLVLEKPVKPLFYDEIADQLAK